MQDWDKLRAVRQQRGMQRDQRGWTQVVHCVGSTRCGEHGRRQTGAGSLLVPVFLPCEATSPSCVSAQGSSVLHSQLCPRKVWKKELGKGVMSQKGGEWGSKHWITAEKNITGRKVASVYPGQEQGRLISVPLNIQTWPISSHCKPQGKQLTQFEHLQPMLCCYS